MAGPHLLPVRQVRAGPRTLEHLLGACRDGARLGQEMRANGGIALLSWLLADPNPEVQQMSLMILGNLCSDSVDANSSATKQALLRSIAVQPTGGLGLDLVDLPWPTVRFEGLHRLPPVRRRPCSILSNSQAKPSSQASTTQGQNHHT